MGARRRCERGQAPFLTLSAATLLPLPAGEGWGEGTREANACGRKLGAAVLLLLGGGPDRVPAAFHGGHDPRLRIGARRLTLCARPRHPAGRQIGIGTDLHPRRVERDPARPFPVARSARLDRARRRLRRGVGAEPLASSVDSLADHELDRSGPRSSRRAGHPSGRLRPLRSVHSRRKAHVTRPCPARALLRDPGRSVREDRAGRHRDAPPAAGRMLPLPSPHPRRGRSRSGRRLAEHRRIGRRQESRTETD
jgi:hypothetical protein